MLEPVATEGEPLVGTRLGKMWRGYKRVLTIVGALAAVKGGLWGVKAESRARWGLRQVVRKRPSRSNI